MQRHGLTFKYRQEIGKCCVSFYFFPSFLDKADTGNRLFSKPHVLVFCARVISGTAGCYIRPSITEDLPDRELRSAR